MTNARQSLCAFIEEEHLDLNDIKSGAHHEYNISPSPSPMPPVHLGDNDFRTPQDTNTVYYDSAVSNIAANTDIDDNDSDDDNDHHGQHQATPNPQIMDINLSSCHHDGNIHYSNDLEVPNTPNSLNITNDKHNHQQQQEEEIPCRSNFKIVVSGPNNENRMRNMNIMNEIDVINMSINDRQNELMSRLKPKRSRRRYIRAEIESGASDDCSSSDDDDEDGMTTENEMENDNNNNDLLLRNSLFLSENNLKRGVYASFSFSDSETDYLSAQSDDFDELTICYHHNRNNNNHNNGDRNNRNIRFRTHLQDANYLSDIGPSDIGSSDTECFSSNDSIPDSIPPPVHPDFVSIN